MIIQKIIVNKKKKITEYNTVITAGPITIVKPFQIFNYEQVQINSRT